MAKVRATCPECGDIEVASVDVKARVCVDDHTSSYAFRCPVCAKATARSTESRVIQLLVGAGSSLTMWRRPAELTEIHGGPALTHDQLDSFHQLLETGDWFSRLASMVKS